MRFILHNLHQLGNLYLQKHSINLINQEIHILQNCQLRKYLKVHYLFNEY